MNVTQYVFCKKNNNQIRFSNEWMHYKESLGQFYLSHVLFTSIHELLTEFLTIMTELLQFK